MAKERVIVLVEQLRAVPDVAACWPVVESPTASVIRGVCKFQLSKRELVERILGYVLTGKLAAGVPAEELQVPAPRHVSEEVEELE